MSDWAGIAWLVVLLAFNAFFVGAEFAVISARRSQIEPLAGPGDAARTHDLGEDQHVIQIVNHRALLGDAAIQQGERDGAHCSKIGTNNSILPACFIFVGN